MDNIEELRKILGSSAENKSDEELKNEITTLELLIEYLLDSAEREIFSGHTFLEMVSNVVSQKNSD